MESDTPSPGSDREESTVDGDGERAPPTDDLDVLVVGPFQRGGIRSFIEEQVRRLDGRVSVSLHESGAPPAVDDRVGFLRGLLMGLVALLRFPFRPRPDVVHVHTSYRFSFYRKTPYVLFANYVWDVPVVLHVHGSSFDDFVDTPSRGVAFLQRRVFAACDEILVLSAYWEDVVSTRADAEKIRVIPNAVDPATFPADASSGTPHVVFVSNLIERKGVRELAEAIDRLCRRPGADFRVTIAGDGPLSDRIERLAERHDEVSYLGYVSEDRKRSLLGEGSIYVLPTYAEGLPIAMLEGMAGGNAVVSTTVGSIPEVVGPDRGILVDPGDVDGLVDALKNLVTSPERRVRMAENNRRAVEECYSWDSVIDTLVDVYRTHKG